MGNAGGVSGAARVTGESTFVVIACDSCGGIGPKDLDVVKVPAHIVGRFTSRVALGRPGGALRRSEIVDIPALTRLLGLDGVHEVIPGGSRGVLHEAEELATPGGFVVGLREHPGLDLFKSAGPATCLIASVEPGLGGEMAAVLRKPVFHVGSLR